MPFVRFRDCTCPESPHAEPSTAWGDLSGDVVELREHLDLAGGAEALRAFKAAIAAAGDDLEAVADHLGEHVSPVYLRRGVLRWNLLDADGDPVPCNAETVGALPFPDAFEIADKADDLYGGEVLAPLLKRIGASSATGSTAKSRRRTPKSSRTPPAP